MFFRTIIHIISGFYHHKAVLLVHQAQADAFQPCIRAAVFLVEFVSSYINAFFFFGRRITCIGLVFGYLSDSLSLSIVLVISGFGCAAIGASLAYGFYELFFKVPAQVF